MSAVNIAFTAPVAIDPRTSPNSRVRTVHVLLDQDAVILDVEYLDTNGDVIRTEQKRSSTQGVANWIAAQKPTVGSMALALIGTTGTVT